MPKPDKKPGGGNGGGGGGGEDPVVVDQLIEGTPNGDRLRGGEGNDTIIGHEGDDQIEGRGGTDTVVLSGSVWDFLWSVDRRGNVTVTDTNSTDGNEGTDSLKSVELLEFDDFTVDLTADNAAILLHEPVSVYVDGEVTIALTALDVDDANIRITLYDRTMPGVFAQTRDYTYENIGMGSTASMTLTVSPGHSYTSIDFAHLAQDEAVLTTYTIQYGRLGEYQYTDVEVTLLGVNDAPELASGLGLTAVEDGGPATLDLSVFADDIDSDDDAGTLSYAIVSAPTDVAVSLSGSVLTLDALDGFQYLNTGDELTRTVTIRVTDRHGASVEQDVTLTIAGADDPLPDYLNEDGSADFTAIGIDPTQADVYGSLDGTDLDPSNLDVVAGFTEGDDTRVISVENIRYFGDYEFFYTDFNTGEVAYSDLGFHTGGGDDRLVFLQSGDAVQHEAVDISLGDGEDVFVLDAHSTDFLRFVGASISTGAQNDQVIIDLSADGVMQVAMNDYYLGSGHDLLSLTVTTTGTPTYGGNGLTGGSSVYAGAGNDTILVDIGVPGVLFGEMDIDVYAGSGDDYVRLDNADSTAAPASSGFAGRTGLTSEIDLGAGDDELVLNVVAQPYESAEAEIIGGDGYDVVMLEMGAAADYAITQTGLDSYVVTTDGQTIRLYGVEEINVTDGSLLDYLA